MVLVTEAFEKLSEMVGEGSGYPELHRVALPHPLNTLPDELIREIAREHLEQVVECLTVASVR